MYGRTPATGNALPPPPASTIPSREPNPTEQAARPAPKYGDIPQACGEPHYLPDPVTRINATSYVGSALIEWEAPASHSSRGILDYQINWTSPPGIPDRPIRDKPPGNATSYLITHLPLQTGSSIRIAAETIHTQKAGLVVQGATIVNVHPSLDFTPGNIDLTNETRNLPERDPHIDFNYTRTGDDIRLTAMWPAAKADRLDCTIMVPTINSTYSHTLISAGAGAPDAKTASASVTLSGIGGRHADIHCVGGALESIPGRPGARALDDRYSISAAPAGFDFPFISWIQTFRAGEWGAPKPRRV